jgi:hypothetical protein
VIDGDGFTVSDFARQKRLAARYAYLTAQKPRKMRPFSPAFGRHAQKALNPIPNGVACGGRISFFLPL